MFKKKSSIGVPSYKKKTKKKLVFSNLMFGVITIFLPFPINANDVFPVFSHAAKIIITQNWIWNKNYLDN